MLKELSVQGYRGLRSFMMKELGRVNLLVGTNNSGKTSVLEAINLLSSAGDPNLLWTLLARRGEQLPPALATPGDRPVRRVNVEFDVSHLFTDHEASIGTCFQIKARNGIAPRSIEYKIVETDKQIELSVDGEGEGDLSTRLAIEIQGEPRPPVPHIPLSRNGGILYDSLQPTIRRLRQRPHENATFPSLFITTESFSGSDLILMWNKIALTPDEGLVLEALRFLDNRIERIAAQVSGDMYYPFPSKSGFIVKCQGWDQPVPIGSMGDGMWRMLAMAIAITQCKGGVLLVDEIDTGLHYSVMSRMWGLIYKTAEKLDVQVFATTHSQDCVRSIAELCQQEEEPKAISIHRIEKDGSESVRYSPTEIVAAAENNVEMR